jgi:hypothetical protein
MATQDYAASVQGVAIRVTRLGPTGALLTGPVDSYTMQSFIRVSFTPEYEAGDEITEKAADGTICVTFQAPDTLKRVTMEIAICEPDPEFTALVSGGVLLTRQGTPGNDATAKSVGWASGQVGEDPSRDGVAVEVWSYAVQNGKRANSNPYFHWIFPYVKVRQSGDRVVENGLLANTFEGFGLGNINFGVGPDGRWEWPSASDRPYAYARVPWAPVGYRGFYTWDPNADPPVGGTPVNTLFDPAAGTNIPGTETYNPGVPIDLILASTNDTPDVAPPTVTSITPTTGPAAGGTTVTATGTHFIGTTGVTVGGVAATQVNVISNTQVSFRTGPHAAGSGLPVVVTTPDGPGTLASAYTYV